MFGVVWRRKGRILSLLACFALGLSLVAVCRLTVGWFVSPLRGPESEASPGKQGCLEKGSFPAPEEVLARLKSGEVGVRRDMLRLLFLSPSRPNAFYDYERDRDFPERVEMASLRFINLDSSPEAEAVITFVRQESPAAVLMKKGVCGWRVAEVLTSWMRFEDYPYTNWIEFPEFVRPGQHLILVRDSVGDATRYSRWARIYKLEDGYLAEVAYIEEESIAPLKGYMGQDWKDVKRRQTARYTLFPAIGNSPARLRVEYFHDTIKYTGDAPVHTSWRDTDGTWHESLKHWRTRACERINPTESSTEQLVWNEQSMRFVKEGL